MGSNIKTLQLISSNYSLPSCRPLWSNTHPIDIMSRGYNDWKSASMIHSTAADDPTIWRSWLNLPRCYWSLIKHFLANQDHCASGCKIVRSCNNKPSWTVACSWCWVWSLWTVYNVESLASLTAADLHSCILKPQIFTHSQQSRRPVFK